MEKIERSALVGFSAQQMYQLVDDVEKYPEFVPYCKEASLFEKEGNSVSATIIVSKSGIAKSFSTKNTLIPFKQIQMQLLNGPFKYLNGYWNFIALTDEACKIELNLEYEFSNKIASMAFAKIFTQLAQSMVAAFTQRADEIYTNN